MKKSLVPMIVGMFVAFGLFWAGQPTGTTTHHQTDGSELPKKSFAKSHVEIQTQPIATATNMEFSDKTEKVKTTSAVSKTDDEAPNKGDFVKKADAFMQEVVQPTDENYKVEDFKTKQELIEYLTMYVTEDVATYYVDGLYEEKQDGLYIIPTELPPWIVKGEPTNLTKVDDEHFRLEQKNSSDLYGDYLIELSFKKEKDNWIIESVDVQ
ncbi:hypothetical protein [Alkalihalobacillus sp. TS-13]|uniref:hypothetical protein n=1 Tax=Alkalihalobacillus sp. TS-13 TaxID=2842455 RepID=UPI001C882CC6|nr:hypothetical protein [Alkalihalobacillus sp. TS-13]